MVLVGQLEDILRGLVNMKKEIIITGNHILNYTMSIYSLSLLVYLIANWGTELSFNTLITILFPIVSYALYGIIRSFEKRGKGFKLNIIRGNVK